MQVSFIHYSEFTLIAYFLLWRHFLVQNTVNLILKTLLFISYKKSYFQNSVMEKIFEEFWILLFVERMYFIYLHTCSLSLSGKS